MNSSIHIVCAICGKSAEAAGKYILNRKEKQSICGACKPEDCDKSKLVSIAHKRFGAPISIRHSSRLQILNTILRCVENEKTLDIITYMAKRAGLERRN